MNIIEKATLLIVIAAINAAPWANPGLEDNVIRLLMIAGIIVFLFAGDRK